MMPTPIRLALAQLTVPSRPSYRHLTIMLAATIALIRLLHFRVEGTDLATVAGVSSFLIVLAILMRRVGWIRIATAIEAATLVMAASLTTGCLSVLFATIALPFQDPVLAQIDRLVWPLFTWREMFDLLRRHDEVVLLMSRVYSAILWQPFALVLILASLGREIACWRFVHAWFVSLTACLVVFPFVTALTPYIHYGIVSADIPSLDIDTGWKAATLLADIRSGAARTLLPPHMTGLISVPSFHAAAAVLLLFWGYRPIPFLNVPFMLLNVAMAATAPLIGAHYFIDIAAGIGVALLSIRIATVDARPTPDASERTIADDVRRPYYADRQTRMARRLGALRAAWRITLRTTTAPS